jgi:hypothetical protein
MISDLPPEHRVVLIGGTGSCKSHVAIAASATVAAGSADVG